MRFAELLEKVSDITSTPFVIALDSLDQLIDEYQVHTLDWLPKNLKVVIFFFLSVIMIKCNYLLFLLIKKQNLSIFII